MNIGFVTCQESVLNQYFPTVTEPDFISPEPLFTPDDFIAATELRTHGHHTSAIIWGTPPQELVNIDLIVVRSPWDYIQNEESKTQFFAWLDAIEKAGLPVANPPSLMRWLLDKHYLQDLASHGVKIIPTQYIEKSGALDLSATYTKDGPLVLKQCVSAGGTGLFFIDSNQAAKKHQAEFNSLLSTTAYMLQPFISEITTHGEWSLTFFGGDYSHSILKKTGKDSIMIHAERGGSLHFPVTPSADVIDFAHYAYQQILPAYKQATGHTCSDSNVLYMRIDIIETKNGPVLVECEGVEPELFFRAHPGSEVSFRLAIERM